MNERNSFKQRLLARESVIIGSWTMAGAPAPAEALGRCGFDFIVVDMEHVPIGISELANMLRAVDNTPARPLVRIPWNDRVTIKQVMDAGAQSIMVPFVQDADEAAAAVAAATYPPKGLRGAAAVQRASQYGTLPGYFDSANSEACVVVQLETPDAIEQLERIASVPGVDGLFVGPGDLAASMGQIGNIGHDDVQSLIGEAAKRAGNIGKPIGIIGPTPQMVKQFLDYGYTFVAIGSDMAFITGRAREFLEAVNARE